MEISRKSIVEIFMPSGENSFYLDRKGTGNAYETFVAKELPAYIRKTYHLPDERENVMIGGLSMGGFGALRLGIKYNKMFSAAFGLSAALIINDIASCSKEEIASRVNAMADYDYYRIVFGDLDKVRDSDINPEYIVKEHLKNGEKLPRIFMACGTEDFLIEQNREFKDFLKDRKANITYYESPGVHEWSFWNEYLEPAVLWAINK
ncbi:MAG: acetylesterase, partial [Lachnospiraceae bacterium]|nr:acetylesterase [Lachnospiraceae bacterium]